MKQEHLLYNQEEKNSVETDPELTEMLELVGQDFQ